MCIRDRPNQEGATTHDQEGATPPQPQPANASIRQHLETDGSFPPTTNTTVATKAMATDSTLVLKSTLNNATAVEASQFTNLLDLNNTYLHLKHPLVISGPIKEMNSNVQSLRIHIEDEWETVKHSPGRGEEVRSSQVKLGYQLTGLRS